MSFMGITPGQGNRFAAERTVALKRQPPGAGEAYGNAYDLLAQHGTWFSGRALPSKYDDLIGPGSKCHTNAPTAANIDSSLRVFCGFYCVGLKLLHHSWCVDPNGEVVEVTFPTIKPPGATDWMMMGTNVPWLPPEHWLYLGVEYEVAFIHAAYDAGFSLPLLDPMAAYGGRYIWSFPYSAKGFPLPKSGRGVQSAVSTI